MNGSAITTRGVGVGGIGPVNGGGTRARRVLITALRLPPNTADTPGVASLPPPSRLPPPPRPRSTGGAAPIIPALLPRSLSLRGRGGVGGSSRKEDNDRGDDDDSGSRIGAAAELARSANRETCACIIQPADKDERKETHAPLPPSPRPPPRRNEDGSRTYGKYPQSTEDASPSRICPFPPSPSLGLSPARRERGRFAD